MMPPTYRHPNPHIINGEFQSDKYPTCPPGKVPLSVKDQMAWPYLWGYAQDRRAVDAEFAEAVEISVIAHGYVPSPPPARHDAEAMRGLVKTWQKGSARLRATSRNMLTDHIAVEVARAYERCADALEAALPPQERDGGKHGG